jgi:phosphonate transport system substrate-binding protein
MRILLASIILLLFSSQSIAAELRIGLVPEQNIFKQMKRYQPLGEYLEKKTGLKVNFIILSRYGNIIDNFNNLNLDGAFWGSFTGAMAIRKLDIEPIARPVNPDGTSSYQGYIFAHKDSIIKNVNRMRHSVIVFVDKATTAGYLYPVAYLKDNGVNNIDRYFKEYFFAGSHDAAIYAVLNKEASVGCAKSTIFDMLALEDPSVKDRLVILARSPHFPSNGLGIRRDLDTSIKKALQSALLEMENDPAGVAVLTKFGVKRFIKASREDYQPVFDIAKKAGIDLNTYDYTNR